MRKHNDYGLGIKNITGKTFMKLMSWKENKKIIELILYIDNALKISYVITKIKSAIKNAIPYPVLVFYIKFVEAIQAIKKWNKVRQYAKFFKTPEYKNLVSSMQDVVDGPDVRRTIYRPEDTNIPLRYTDLKNIPADVLDELRKI